MDNSTETRLPCSLTAMLSTGRESHEAIPIIVLCLTHQERHQEFHAKKRQKFLGVLICLVMNRGTWLPFLAGCGSPAFSEHVLTSQGALLLSMQTQKPLEATPKK